MDGERKEKRDGDLINREESERDLEFKVEKKGGESQAEADRQKQR